MNHNTETTPLELNVDRLQSEGHSLYVAGWTDDGRYALVVIPAQDSVTVASKNTANGIGRWECSIAHYRGESELYAARFPRHVR